jgi:alpha-beta hydrolase superfamily lysophospholipase
MSRLRSDFILKAKERTTMDQQTEPREGTFKGKDDFSIFYRAWLPQGTPRAVVLIVPGFNSHSGYFRWAAERLTADGIAAYAVDLRGRGRSDGERFYLETISDYVGDVEGLMGVVRREHPGLPVHILGHSAGGVVACLFTLEHQGELAGLICESFAFQVPAPDFAIAALKGLSHLAPHAHVLKVPNKAFSRDPAVVAAMDADPLIANETQPTRTVAELARADDRLKRQFPDITLPVLILHGTKDQATRFSGSQQFYDMAGSRDKTLKLYEGHFHDLLNDLEKEKVMADILAWLDARLG